MFWGQKFINGWFNCGRKLKWVFVWGSETCLYSIIEDARCLGLGCPGLAFE